MPNFKNRSSSDATSNRVNFDDPESPDYTSPSPAFVAYYAKIRAEKSDREFMQQLEHEAKINAMSSKDSDSSPEDHRGKDPYEKQAEKALKCERRKLRIQDGIMKFCTVVVIVSLAIIICGVIFT